jgi:predicted DCC family thiol-disulfide oxidoreductase YuxK
MPTPPDTDRIELVYDGQCPICTAYCCNLTARPDINLTLVDARRPGATMAAITAQGLDIDQGMVLKVGDQLLYGDAAIMALNAYLQPNTAMGWLNRLFFDTPRRAQIFYALGKALRNGVLKILGIKKINNLGNTGT